MRNSSPEVPAATHASSDAHRETVPQQRINSEQRRRNELREGYARLKETLLHRIRRQAKCPSLTTVCFAFSILNSYTHNSANSPQPYQVPQGYQGTTESPTEGCRSRNPPAATSTRLSCCTVLVQLPSPHRRSLAKCPILALNRTRLTAMYFFLKFS